MSPWLAQQKVLSFSRVIWVVDNLAVCCIALQDKKEQKIVCNESAEILKTFAGLKGPESATPCPDYYPVAKRAEIDRISTEVVNGLGMQVYKCVFAKSQASRASFLSPIDYHACQLSRS